MLTLFAMELCCAVRNATSNSLDKIFNFKNLINYFYGSI